MKKKRLYSMHTLLKQQHPRHSTRKISWFVVFNAKLFIATENCPHHGVDTWSSRDTLSTKIEWNFWERNYLKGFIFLALDGCVRCCLFLFSHWSCDSFFKLNTYSSSCIFCYTPSAAHCILYINRWWCQFIWQKVGGFVSCDMICESVYSFNDLREL